MLNYYHILNSKGRQTNNSPGSHCILK